MDATIPAPESPFSTAGGADRRLKLFVWGDSGTGKTTLSLRFPSPVVIDMEGGADLYGDAFQFDRLRTTDADAVMEAVDWLTTSNHG
ncbi:MAG: AAA family ATPase, partial [Candidatus Eisenbacteria bacterium]